MEKVNISQTNAFKVAYLLGTDVEHMRAGFPDLYDKYDELSLFDRVPIINKVRSLSRIRQGLIREHSYYKRYSALPTITKGIDTCDIECAKDNGFDLVEVYTVEANLTGTINAITKSIDANVNEALTVLGVVQPQKIAVLFYLHELDKKTGLTQFVKGIKNVNFPYHQIIAKHNKIAKVLRYILMNDKNLLIAAYSILGERYDNSFEFPNIDTYYENYRNVKRIEQIKEAPKEEATEEVSEVEEVEDAVMDTCSEDIPTGDVEEVEIAEVTEEVIEATVETENIEEVKSTEEAENIEEVKVIETSNTNTNEVLTSSSNSEEVNVALSKINAYLNKKKNVVAFVDCDNINFFTFLGALSRLEKNKEISEIRLYVDEKSSYLWKNLKDIYSSKLNIYIKHIKRIKDNKSVTDMVIATDICQYVLKNKSSNILLFSSDCDYFGVMENLMPTDTKGVNYLVGYSANYTSSDYLSKLTSQGIPAFDIDAFNDVELNRKYESLCIKYLIARNIVNVPPIHVSMEKTREIVCHALDNESLEGVSQESIDEVLKLLKGKISFKFRDDNILEVTVDDVVIRLQQN